MALFGVRSHGRYSAVNIQENVGFNVSCSIYFSTNRFYGQTNAHKALLAKGEQLPPWREVKIRCHDFRVGLCTRAYKLKIPTKTMKSWMGHEDATMIM